MDDEEEKKLAFKPGYNGFPNIDNPKYEGIYEGYKYDCRPLF
ncbi:MAG: hypothetical protein ACMUIL_10990 [bacterium]